MKIEHIDAEIMLTRADVIADGGFQANMAEYLRAMRGAAMSRAESQGGHVVPTAQPELVVKEGIHPLFGDIFILASRWPVEVPDSAVIEMDR